MTTPGGVTTIDRKDAAGAEISGVNWHALSRDAATSLAATRPAPVAAPLNTSRHNEGE